LATIEGFGAAPGLHADFLIIRGNAQAKKGEHETAIATYESALAGTQDAPSPTREAAIYNGLGNVVGHLGQQPSSLDYYRRSLRLTEEHYGAEHPECAARWINIGIALH
jgi:tetratricopeptide (TPR) repeat protein